MDTPRTCLAGLALALGLGWTAVAAAGLDCVGPLPDCLLDNAIAAAETVGRSDTRDEIGFSIAAALAELGRLDDAVATAGQISNPRILAEAQGAISAAAARAGDFARARRIALSIVDSQIRSVRVGALQTVAVHQASVGEVDAAFDTVLAIDNPFRRSEAQAAIAAAVARSGDVPGAIRAAVKIATNYWFTEDQQDMKVASGLVNRSKDFDQFWFHEALGTIAEVQAMDGDLLGAMKTARAIPDADGRSRAASRIAAIQAGSGDIAGARATAAGIEVAYGDLDAMVAIAKATAAAGDFDGARVIAGTLARGYGDHAALVALAIAQAERGLTEAALATAAGIETLDGRAQALSGISLALAREGRLDDALAAVATIPARSDRARVVGEMAVSMAATDPGRAIEVAAAHVGPRDRDEIVVAVALAQARAGDVEGAIETAMTLEDAMYRAIALAGLAPLVR